MKFRLMDLLACPICKKFPLELLELKVNRYEGRHSHESYPLCELYCGYRREFTKDLGDPPCEECIRLEVDVGVLYCENCGRWYPIDEEIPRMLPDDLRDKKEDLTFLEKHRERIPEKILLEGRPINFSS